MRAWSKQLEMNVRAWSKQLEMNVRACAVDLHSLPPCFAVSHWTNQTQPGDDWDTGVLVSCFVFFKSTEEGVYVERERKTESATVT